MAEDSAMIYPNNVTSGLDNRDQAAMPMSDTVPAVGGVPGQGTPLAAGGAGFSPAPDLVPNAQQPPQYLGFENLFHTMFPKVDEGLRMAASNLWQTLHALYSNGNGKWHDAAYQYDFPEFVRDTAVVAAARQQAASGTGQKEAATPAKQKQTATQPASRSSNRNQ